MGNLQHAHVGFRVIVPALPASAEAGCAGMVLARNGSRNMERTIAQVKAELPDVKVMHNGKRHLGRVSGRLNQFATVSIGYSPALRDFVDFQFSWEAIARAVNSGLPLRTD